jgi:hypothetical protein
MLGVFIPFLFEKDHGTQPRVDSWGKGPIARAVCKELRSCKEIGFVELEELANETKPESSLQHSKFSLFDNVDHRGENRRKNKNESQKSCNILERHPNAPSSDDSNSKCRAKRGNSQEPLYFFGPLHCFSL